MRLDPDSVTLTPEEIKKALERPDSFAYMGDEEGMFETWSMGPVIEHRESDALDRSNAEALRRYLATMPDLADDYQIDKANHWAVGWVTHLTYRVIDAEGKPTKIAKIVKGWFAYLRDVHPVADEDLWSEYEQEDADQTWKNCFTEAGRIKFIREHRHEFEFHSFADLLGCVRGKYYAGYASTLLG